MRYDAVVNFMVVRACDVMNNAQLYSVFVASHYELALFGDDTPVPEFIDPVFAITSPKRSFSMTENERFGIVFVKTGSINSGTGGLLGDVAYIC
jgi:hypothetical protein